MNLGHWVLCATSRLECGVVLDLAARWRVDRAVRLEVLLRLRPVVEDDADTLEPVRVNALLMRLVVEFSI